ncbi:hypothetical protein OS493_026252 [Desmophyllum pertusum]|uniref:Uncharacterized protein n=1 Tax=Desmophyllum pertusum TaxID=174260 RepID=A0A9W9ZL67_9CNID|nr:hypothetical protein OS493_026252 [Desmophyllum pertusum]
MAVRMSKVKMKKIVFVDERTIPDVFTAGSESDSDSGHEECESEDEGEPSSSLGESFAKKKPSKKQSTRMTQENEFTTLLNSTSTVEPVYELIHSNVYEKKKAEHFAETSSPPAVQREESFDKIYSFAGWSLNSMKNTRTRALAGKGYEVSQSRRRKAVEEELSFVDMLCHKNKKEIKNNSTFLRELDVAVGSEKGGLTFPAPEIQPFYHDLDGEVRELINVKNHKKYGKSLLRIAEDSLLSNLELSDSFDKCVKDLRRESSPETVKTVTYVKKLF